MKKIFLSSKEKKLFSIDVFPDDDVVFVVVVVVIVVVEAVALLLLSGMGEGGG